MVDLDIDLSLEKFTVNMDENKQLLSLLKHPFGTISV
jgi:hypothetical protein